MEREGRAAKTVTFFKKTTVTRWQHQSVAAAEGKDSVLMYLQHLSGDGRSDLLIIDLRFSGFNAFLYRREKCCQHTDVHAVSALSCSSVILYCY